jgi:hypothetical protein
MTITGSGGGVSHAITVTLIVAQAPDFQISVTPPSQSAIQGQTVSFAVNVVALNGFNSPVSLAVSGLPSGVNGAFSASSGSPDFESTLTLTISSNASTGSFTVTATGTGGGTSHVANAILVINPVQQAPSASSASSASSTSQNSNLLAGDIIDELQSNIPMVLGGLIVILLVAILVVLTRRKEGGTTAIQTTKPGTRFCPQCGTPNLETSQYCVKCGTGLSGKQVSSS